MIPIIQVSELLELYSSETLVLVDASGGKDAKNKYAAKHLDRALFVDVNTQLADIKADLSQGGRHPLPALQQFSGVLTSLGITPKNHVVVYDDQQGANAAARFWWMLKSIGHEAVQVLDGGFQEALRMGLPTQSGTTVPVPATSGYPLDKWNLPLTDLTEVENVSNDKNYRVIDVRSRERYDGDTEPIDLIAGHIPGAINIPFTENLGANGHFLSPSELRKKYENVLRSVGPEKTIVHCGSGVTACHTLLALDLAGLEIPKLYVGSWSEWSRCNKPIATKETDKK